MLQKDWTSPIETDFVRIDLAFANKVSGEDLKVKQKTDQKARPGRRYFRLRDVDLTRVSAGGKPEAVYGLEQTFKVSKYASPPQENRKFDQSKRLPPQSRDLNKANKKWKLSLSDTKQVSETLSTDEDYQDTYLPSILV